MAAQRAYPGIWGKGRQALFVRRFLGICLRTPPSLMDDEEGWIRLPRPLLLVLGDYCLSSHWKTAGELIAMAAMHIDLDIDSPVFDPSTEKTPSWAIAPHLDPAVVATDVAFRECRIRREPVERWSLETGKPHSRSRRREVRQGEYDDQALAAARDLPHPAGPLLRHLNSARAGRAWTKLITQNWDAMVTAILDLNDPSTRDQSLSVAAALVDMLEAGQTPVYRPAESSARTFTEGWSLHQLPRAVRRLALSGERSYTIDIRSAQLEFNVRAWGCEKLQHELDRCRSEETSVWATVLGWARAGLEHKDILKRWAFSLCFGMSERTPRRDRRTGMAKLRRDGSTYPTLHRLLRVGDVRQGVIHIPGMGKARSRRLMRHPAVRELLEARRRELRAIEEVGGAVDVFGRKLSTQNDAPTSVMAQLAQAWELKVMLGALPVLDALKDHVAVVSWLHDGLTIVCRDRQKAASQARRIAKAIEVEAASLGYPVSVEVTQNT